MPACTTTFGRRTNLILKGDIGSLISDLANGQGKSIFFCNVHMLMLSDEDPLLASAMDQADWVFADGVPIAWLQRRITGKNARVVRGYEMMLAICKRAADDDETVGFLGSTPDVLENLAKNLSSQFQNLKVSYQYCPPFATDEIQFTPEQLLAIRESGVRWLFVALGCPKQEKWIFRYGDGLNCHVLGVGAAFDWLAGTVSKPPEWMERSGLGWVYRLLVTPGKVWKRYLKFNTKFILQVFKRLLFRQSFE